MLVFLAQKVKRTHRNSPFHKNHGLKTKSLLTILKYIGIRCRDVSDSEEDVIAIARKNSKSVSWTADGEVVTNFFVLQEPVEITSWPHPREPLKSVHYWYITLHLEKVYPDNVNAIGFGIWMDTGVARGVKTISAG